MRRLSLWTVCVLLLPAAGASMVEDLTGVRYQDDGGTGADASDVCEDPYPELPALGVAHGMLVPGDDPLDAWALPIDDDDDDGRVTITLTAVPSAAPELVQSVVSSLRVFAPGGCGDLPTAVCLLRDPDGQPPGDSAESCTVEFAPRRTGTFTVEVAASAIAPAPAAGGSTLPAHSHCSPACYALDVRVA